MQLVRDSSPGTRLSSGATIIAWPLQGIVSEDSQAFERMMVLPLTDFQYAKQGRSVGRCELTMPDGRHVVYLKRYLKAASRWQAFLSLAAPSVENCPAFAEWRNHLRASAWSLPVPQVVAVGESIGPWFRHRSLIAIQELHDMLPLHLAVAEAARLKTAATFRIWKYSVAREVARLVVLLHRHHYFHKDLYLSHFFCPLKDIQADSVRQGTIHLIDLHRLHFHPWLGLRWKAQDLAQLLYSSELPQIDRRDRLCFLRGYLGRGNSARPVLSWMVRIQAWHFRNHNARMHSPVKGTPR
jgi:heptose I phosphotransferase